MASPRLGGVRLGTTDSFHQSHGRFHGRVGAWHQLTSLLHDEVSPGFILVSPPALSTIGANTALVFTVTDADVNSPLQTYTINLRFVNLKRTEQIQKSQDGATFQVGYQLGSFRTVIPYGFLFSVVRDDGWCDTDIILTITATDTLGNVMTPAVTTWTVGNPSPAQRLLVLETL